MATFNALTCSEFVDACTGQGAGLHERLEETARQIPDDPAIRLSTTIGVMFAAEGATYPLAGKPLEDIRPDDDGASLIQHMINHTIDPAPSDGTRPYFAGWGGDDRGKCASIEPAFAQTLVALKDGILGDPALECGGEIFVDNAGVAYALRKHKGYSSSLLLREVNADGLVLPAGTAVILGVPHEYQDYFNDYVNPNEFAIRKPAGEELTLARLSGFAVRPSQREYNADFTDEKASALYKTLPTDELLPLVQRAADVLPAFS